MVEKVQGEGTGSDFIDRRARLHAKPQQKNLVYGDPSENNILKLLHPQTPGSPHGMIWPYTPAITYQQSVDYQSYDLTHVNQEPYTYAKTQALRLNVASDFPVQNAWEARYWLACFHLLRTITKMQFGKRSNIPGAPPPVMLFSAHGDYMFNRMPVLIDQFSITLDDSSDYIKTEIDGTFDIPSFTQNPQGGLKVQGTKKTRSGAGVAWVPSKSNISVSLIHQNSLESWVNEFSWRDFRSGKLLKRGWN